MIQYMRPDHLEKISLMDNQSVPFAFSLTQMIYTILIEVGCLICLFTHFFSNLSVQTLQLVFFVVILLIAL